MFFKRNQKKKNRRMPKKILAAVMAGLMILMPFQSNASTATSKIVTPSSLVSKSTNEDIVRVTVNGSKGKRTFRVFAQGGSFNSKRSFVALHGCAVCSLTTVLSGYTTKYQNYTPAKTYKKLEKQVFGQRRWNANYKKSMSAQRPISLYGISKVLRYCHVSNKYVRYFKDAKAIKQIENHLKKGEAVIVEVNNRRQKNGRIISSYTSKWSSSKHTMVLLGMTNTGKVIVADSAYRKWSGSRQRVKFTTMKQLVSYMIPCTRSSSSVYYNSVASCGGYILVNP